MYFKLSNKDSNLKPVMVWFYGGAYITGNGKTDMYGPDFLLTEDIVLVTFNHRIGIIGIITKNVPLDNFLFSLFRRVFEVQ